MTLGLTEGISNYGLNGYGWNGASQGAGVVLNTSLYGTNTGVGGTGGAQGDNKGFGITTNSEKSGIVAEFNPTQLQAILYIKY